MKTKANFLLKIFPTFLAFLAISTAANAAVIIPDLDSHSGTYSTLVTNGATFGGGLQSVNSLLQISNADKLIVGSGDESVLGVTPPSGNFIGNYKFEGDKDYSTNPLGILFDTMASSVTLTFGIVDELAFFPSSQPPITTIEFWGNSGILGSVSEVFALTENEMLTTSYLTHTFNFNTPFLGIVITTKDAQGLEYQVSYNTSTPVPEPAAAWLMVSGLGLLGFFVRKNKK